MIYLAYDGSVNGDWISRYAICMAAQDTPRALTVLCVEDGKLPADMDAKLQRLARESDMAGVTIDIRLLSQADTDDVAGSLSATVTPGTDNFLVCGARVRSRDRGFLSGTVSERLLRWRGCNVVALRVVQPGLLGTPHNLLMPVGGSSTGLADSLPFLRLMATSIQRLDLVHVVEVSSFRFHRLSTDRARQLRRDGVRLLHEAETQICAGLDPKPPHIDVSAVVSDDWAKEVIISASRLKSHLIVLEAPKQDLRARYVFGNRLEEILRNAPCDVAVYRGADT